MATNKSADAANAVKEFQNVQELLSFLQRSLKVPKDRHNSFGDYNYRNAEDIMEAVKKVLPEGATLFCSDTMQFLGERYYVTATATLTYKDKSLFTTASAREDLDRKKMNPEQLTGAASSFARKYALNGLLILDDTKDADAANDGKDEKPKEAKATPEQIAVKAKIEAIKAEIEKAPASEDVTYVVHKHIEDIQKLSPAQQKYINDFAAHCKGKFPPVNGHAQH